MSDALIPTRFLTTLAHLLAIVMLFSSYENNIRVALATTSQQSEYEDAETMCAPQASAVHHCTANPSAPSAG